MLEELGNIQSRIAEIQSRLDALNPIRPSAAPFSDALRQAQGEGSVTDQENAQVSASPVSPQMGSSRTGRNVFVTPAALGPLPTHGTPLTVSPTDVIPLQTGSTDVNGLAETYAAKYGLPSALVKAVIQTESGGNPRAVSHAGAMGLMQLMPANVKEAGISDPFDPEQNIAAGTAQLAGLMQQYGGDVDLTLAGYNAGPGNVKKWGGVPPFHETQNYIRKVRMLMEKE